MSASGNTFLMTETWAPLPASITQDQVLYLLPSTQGDITLRIFNQDGSEAFQCGNGLRATATHFFKQNPEKDVCAIEIQGALFPCFKRGDAVEVTLGFPKVRQVTDQQDYVEMGNRHIVVWGEDDIAILGPRIQQQDPAGINVHVVKVQGRDALSIQHWERGVGRTLACGSGAVAAVAAGHHRGLLNETVTVYFVNDTAQVRRTPHGYTLLGRAQYL